MKKNYALKRLALHAMFLLSLLLILGNASYAQTWQQEGMAQFTNDASALSTVHHPITGDIYVAYADATDGEKLKVKTYNGTNWEDVGATISVVEASLLSIKFNPVTNEPWVAYRRAAAKKLNIRKYDSNTDSWLDAGTDVSSSDPTQKLQLNFSPTGDAYVAYLETDPAAPTWQITRVYTNKSGSWAYMGDITGYGREYGFDYPVYNRIFFFQGYGGGQSKSVLVKRNLNTNGTSWAASLTLSDEHPILKGLATTTVTNSWLSSDGSSLVFKDWDTNHPTPPSSDNAEGKYLQLEFNPIDGNFYFLFVDENQNIQLGKYNRTDWTLLNAIGASIPSGSNIIPKLNINEDNGNVYVSYQDGSKISTQYFTVTPAPDHFYVDKNATGNDDGSSWADAFTSLHDGLAAVNTSLVTDGLWVAQGTYKPHASSRTTYFNVPANANVYGGFNGTETTLNERNWKNNLTILSGDLEDNDDTDLTVSYTNIFRYDNSYRLIYVDGNDVTIDGITITGGHANHASSEGFKRGAAIYKKGTVTNLTIKNSIITKNVSVNNGNVHAVFSGGTNAVNIENCIISNNFARYGSGLGINAKSNATIDIKIYNSLFYANVAADINAGDGFSGSSMYLPADDGTINFEAINNTFANNEDLGTNGTNDKGTIIFRRLNDNSSAVIHATFHNNIFFENLSEVGVTNPQVIGFMNRPSNKLNSLTFTHNISNQTDFSSKATSPVVSNIINSDPLFTDAANMDYSITASSPAVDVGDNTVLPIELIKDLKGFDRITNTTVDMGAYEFRVPNLVAPTVITQDITVQLDASGQVNIIPSQIDNGSTDDDTSIGNLILSLDTASFTCIDLGANTVILSVSDIDGNVGTATAIVTVADSLAPTAITQNVTLQLDAAGNAELTTTAANNASSDNCTEDVSLIFTLSQATFSCSEIGENTVTLTVEDASGNTSSADLTVTIEDDRIPYSLFADKTIYLDTTGNLSVTAASLIAFSSDNCTAPNDLILTLDKPTFTCADLGANTLEITTTDENGNIHTTHATITVADTLAPVVNMVAGNVNLVLDATGNITLLAGDVYTSISDNCTATESLTLSLDNSTFTCTDLGENIVTITVTDASGNQTTDTVTVVILDETAPTAIAQDITVQLDANGSVTVLASAVNNSSTDNCTAANDLAFGLSQETFTCTDLGENTVTLTVTDSLGNHSTSTAIITVADEIAPTAIAQNITIELDANGTASITATAVHSSSTDNCTAVENLFLSLDKKDFTCSDLGANTVTLFVIDASSNVGTATATVTVQDNIAPTAIAKNIEVRLDANDNATITADDINDNSTDNCASSLSLNIDVNTFNLSNLGANTVTLTADDGHGNTNSTTSTVTILEFKQEQTITFDAVEDKTWGDGDITLAASASSGLAVEFTVISGPATLSGSIASINAAGDVVIRVSQAGDDNFVAVSELISFTVNKATLSITADAQSITYGDEIPSLTFTYAGFVNNQNSGAMISEPVASSAAVLGSNVGEYDIILTGGEVDNYDITLASAILQITATTLTVTADAKSITYGEAVPELTFSYDGFVNSEAVTALTNEPSISTTATADSDAGAYGITLAGGEASNYAISLVDATLTIEKIAVEITVTDLEYDEDGTAKSPTVTTNPADLNFNITYDGNEAAPISGGEYEVIVTIDEVNHQGEHTATLIINSILGIEDETSIQVNIYPNPVSDILTIDSEKNINGQVRLFNIEGVEVQSSVLERNKTHLILSSISTGLYILVIQDEKSAIIKKQTIIVNR